MQIIHTLKEEFPLVTRHKAIVSLLFNVDDSAAANPLFSNYNLDTKGSDININLKSILNSQIGSKPIYYNYEGSFTMPNCDEVVNWYILDKTFTLTSAQYRLFTREWENKQTFAGGRGNNRNIKSTNSRTLKKGGLQCGQDFVYFFSFFILYIFICYFIFYHL